jgi:hypothetical protein
MKKYTKAEVARKLNVSRQTVYNLIKRDILIPDENGLIAIDHFPADGEKCQDENVEFTECKDKDTIEAFPGLTERKDEELPIELQKFHEVAVRSPRLKDKYIACLEEHLTTQYRYITNLEKQIKELLYRLEQSQKSAITASSDYWYFMEAVREQVGQAHCNLLWLRGQELQESQKPPEKIRDINPESD